MKKRIAIVTQKMITGGIEVSLLSMINNIDSNNYEITIFLVEKGGELEGRIPSWVNIKYIFNNENSIMINQLKDSVKEFKLKESIINFKSILEIHATKKKYKIHRSMCKTLANVEGKYDMAISYHNPISFSTIYVIEKIKALKKIMWIHSDINEYIDIVDANKKYYEIYDNIFCVSKGSLDAFNNRYSYLKNKTQVYHNSIVKSSVINSCNKSKYCYDDFKGEKILTVARLDHEKGIDLIPKVVKTLKADGYNFRWYCIGDGSNRGKIEELIKLYKVEEFCIVMGNKKNPYEFMKDCDIYVQPSRYEAYGMTIAEAKCFNKPIVATNVMGCKEQINDNINGIIVDVNEYSIYLGVKKILDDNELKNKLSFELSKESIDTRCEINKLYDLM